MDAIKNKIILIKNYILVGCLYRKYTNKVISYMLRRGDFTNQLFEDIRNQYIRCTIPYIYKNASDSDLLDCISYVERNQPAMFCYDDAQASHYDICDVHYDKSVNLYFGYWGGKKLYLKCSINTPEMAQNYLSNLIWEQSCESPHRYLTEKFNVSLGGVVLDVGGAEGNFALTVIDKASKIYIFECDEEWIEALNYTFAEYKDKIEIIRKYVCDRNSPETITLDRFISDYNIDRIDMIKMDIEGAEISAIKGSKKSIRSRRINKWTVCTYHNPKDARVISWLLRDYLQEYSRGYIMSVVWRRSIKAPYWVRGVLRANYKEPLIEADK